MATYKVPQDVEAEDKLLGPFTLRQFIYLIIVFLGGWLTVVFARTAVTMIFIPIALLPALFFGLLVFLGVKNQSQPAEMYLAALVRYYFKPHKRIWDQEGVLENVHITAPKREVHVYSDSRTRNQVRSNLSQLADLMDSRGWAAKNTSLQANVFLPQQQSVSDDRLIALSQMPQVIEPTDLHARDDIMDEQASPVAQAFDQMIIKKQQEFKDQAIARMHDPSYDPYPEMHQAVIRPLGQEEGTKSQIPNASPPAVSQQGDDSRAVSADGTQTNAASPYDFYDPYPAPAVDDYTPPPPDPTITNLLQNASDDLSVQTLASEAQRLKDLESGDEISLH